MKRKLLLALIALLAAGLVFTGCGEDNGEPEEPDYGTNLVTEAAILAATGTGGTAVTKEGDKYKVTGTVTAYSNWDGSVQDKRIVLNIQANPADPDAYFKQANRYIFSCEFPSTGIKPYDTYTDGFRIYLENTKATGNTGIWEGTWQHEFVDEYNACKGVGPMKINRDLTVDGTGAPTNTGVGDYQHLVITLGFEDADVGKSYTFYITKAEVYGESVTYFPNFWDNYVNFSSGSGPFTTDAIAPNWNNEYNQCVYTLSNENNKLFTGGYYLEITLGNNEVTPVNAFAVAYDAANAGDWGSQNDVNVTSNSLVFKWDGSASVTQYKTIMIGFRWPTAGSTGAEIGKTLSFTVNTAKVGALVN